MLEIVFLEKAKEEILCARGWYKNISLNLEKLLILEIKKYCENISANPEMYPTFLNGYRRCLLKLFKYAIYYKIIENKVVIFRFRHEKQNFFK